MPIFCIELILFAGYYIYIETSSPRHLGQKAAITSGLQKATPATGQCLSFWYHMFGAHVNYLNVYIQTGTGNRTMIWNRAKTQGNIWKNAQRTVKSSVPYQIVFEGVVGQSWQGDIALDDISLSLTPCTIPAYSCDFDADICGWVQDKNDQFDWTRDRNGTYSAQTGPRYDHTTNSPYGYYIYIESSQPRRQGDLARISTPQYGAAAGSMCLTFWYHMYGQNTGSLTVFVQDTAGKHQVWQRNGNQVNLWLYTMVTLTPSGAYKVRIQNV